MRDDPETPTDLRFRERTEALEAALADLRLRDEQLRQSRELEAVGRLAGGVAHEFNNLLGIIIAQTDLLAPRAMDVETGDGLARIRDAAARGADLTRQLLAFGRRQVFLPETLDLNQVIAESVELLRRLLGENIKIALAHPAPGARAVWVLADRSQIEQIVLNLSLRARDAMPKGGRLALTVHLSEVPPNRPVEPGTPPGRYAVITFEDDGPAIPSAQLDRLFEPYLGTLEPGAGLGLASVYGIARQSGGFVEVASEEGLGTRFRVTLPAVPPPEEGTDASHSAPETGPEPACETPTGVLVVEDEEMLRTLSRAILEAAGYEVRVAAAADEALALAAERAPGLLITDVVLPGLDGPDLAERLRATQPQMRVLFVSGHAQSIVAGRVALTPETLFLQKPYSRDALLQAVARAFAAPA